MLCSLYFNLLDAGTLGNQKVEVYLLKRMALEKHIAGSTSLLGSIYVIFKKFNEVQRYNGCRPYSLQKTWIIRGMNPIDIATNYARICVYVLDCGNRCIWRIQREAEPKKLVTFIEEKDLMSMSVTENGGIAIMWKKTKISVFDDAGQKLLSTDVLQTSEVSHATEVKEGSFIGCNDRQLFKFSADGNVTKLVDNTGGCYILQTDNRNVIVVDAQGHRVLMVDCDTLELRNTLLTIDRDGTENPHHGHFALDTGELLISWLHYLDVYSFNESEMHSNLAANKQETRDQRVVERAFLEMELSQNEQHQELQQLVRAHLTTIVDDNLILQQLRTSGRFFYLLQPTPFVKYFYSATLC